MYFKTDKKIQALSCVYSFHKLRCLIQLSKNEFFSKYFLEYEQGVK